MFDAQVALIRETYGIEPGEIDLPLLPIFALFNPALGMTSIVPEMDPRHPARADPAKIVQAIQQEKVTNSFGSPTLWTKVAEYCRSRGIELPSLRRVLCAGAPVPAGLWESSRSFLTGGRLKSPYGATEALPVSTVSADEIDPSSTRGACVGRPLRGIDVKIIPLSDQAVASLAPGLAFPSGTVGEIIVRGPVVTRQYDGLAEATAAAKIADPRVAGGFWHRMGDCGFLDDSGKLWFLGRKAERVVTPGGTLYTEPCEQVFRRHPRARRCALIGVGSEPALVAETATRGNSDAAALAAELRKLALGNAHTARIETFYFRRHLPVDVRHNAKIHRLALAKWAVTARAYRAA
jgi:acyl-CoA synthetase (AMP-forming)/AMP-acid ligase II